MSKVILLNELKTFTLAVTRDLVFPVAQQKEDPEPPPPKAVDVFRTRLPDSNSAKKKVPYILHQFINSKDMRPPGQRIDRTAVIRSIFCVYNPDEEEGGLSLLTLMDRMTFSLLERPIVGAQFELDLEAGIEMLAYPDPTAPYFSGEMITVWKLPPVNRLDATRVIHGMPPWDPAPRHLEETIKLKGSDRNGQEERSD